MENSNSYFHNNNHFQCNWLYQQPAGCLGSTIKIILEVKYVLQHFHISAFQQAEPLNCCMSDNLIEFSTRKWGYKG